MKETASELKLSQLEKEVEANLAKIDLSKPGCFGTLVRKIDDSECKECAEYKKCNETMKASDAEQMVDINKELEVIGVKYEIDTELTAIKEAEAKAKAEAEEKARKETNEAEAKAKAKPEKKVEMTDLRKAPLKMKTRIDVDWDGIILEILNKRPTKYSGVAKVVRGKLDKKYTASAYNYTNKILDGLRKQ